jgi:hypothetical protein
VARINLSDRINEIAKLMEYAYLNEGLSYQNLLKILKVLYFIRGFDIEGEEFIFICVDLALVQSYISFTYTSNNDEVGIT